MKGNMWKHLLYSKLKWQYESRQLQCVSLYCQIQTAITLFKLEQQKSLVQETQIVPKLFCCSTTSRVKLCCVCSVHFWHTTRVVPVTAPTSWKRIFCLFITMIQGSYTQKLMLVFYGTNSMHTSSYCTPTLGMCAFSVHTQVIDESYVCCSTTATYRQLLQISWHSVTQYLSEQL